MKAPFPLSPAAVGAVAAALGVPELSPQTYTLGALSRAGGRAEPAAARDRGPQAPYPVPVRRMPGGADGRAHGQGPGAHDRGRVRGPTAGGRRAPRPRARDAAERALRTRPADAGTVRCREVRRHRRRDELGEVPPRRPASRRLLADGGRPRRRHPPRRRGEADRPTRLRADGAHGGGHRRNGRGGASAPRRRDRGRRHGGVASGCQRRGLRRRGGGALRRPDRRHLGRGGGTPRLPRRDRCPAHAGLMRRVRHRRRQLPVQLRRGGQGRGAASAWRSGRRGSPRSSAWTA